MKAFINYSFNEESSRVVLSIGVFSQIVEKDLYCCLIYNELYWYFAAFFTNIFDAWNFDYYSSYYTVTDEY